MMSLTEEAEALVAALQAEAARPASARGSRASDHDLEVAISGVKKWLDERSAQPQLARLATDTWSFDDPLSDRVVRFADLTAGHR